MTEILDWLFYTPGFVPRTQCGVGWVQNPGIAFATQFFDVLIFACYVLIPTCLLRAHKAWVSGRQVNDPRTGALLFVGFTAFCGLTHFMDRLLFQVPAYGLDCLVRGACAAFSFATVLWLIAPDRYTARPDGTH